MTERRTNVRRPAPRRRGGGNAGAARRYAIVKWALLAALIAYAVMVVGANAARDVDIAVIRDAIAAAPGVSGLKALDENGFQERMDASPAGCEGWVMYGSDEIMDVSEALVAKGDATALPFEDGAFDVTISNTVCEHIEPAKFYGEQRRVLKEGGVCLVLSSRKGINITAKCLAEDEFERTFWEKIGAMDDSFEKYGVARYAMAEDELAAAMAQYGFRDATTGYAIADLTPDDPKYPREMALSMIEANRRGRLESIGLSRLVSNGAIEEHEFDEMARRVNVKFDLRAAQYERGEKQWDTNVSVIMVVRGVK